MKKETVKLNLEALRLVDTESHATVTFTEGDEKKPVIDMLAYSGGIIKNHWWWGDLSIDLAGMSFPKKRFPLLEDHNTDKKIGFIKKLSTEDNKLTVVDASFIDTPESIKFREASSSGFPYEASIFAKPTQIQRLMENETAEVNGYTMKGPGTIWRKSVFKEASVCTFGYDSNTKSVALSEGDDVSLEYEVEGEEQLTEKEDQPSMKFQEYKEKHPEEFAKLSEEIAASLEEKFAAEKAEIQKKLDEAVAENTKLSEENVNIEKRIVSLERAEMIRAEQSLKQTADLVFAEKFKDSGLPERLSGKIRKLVSHDAFIQEGKFDKEAFSAAIDEELKEWTASVGDTTTVLGLSTASKGSDLSDDAGKLSDEVSDRMLAHIK